MEMLRGHYIPQKNQRGATVVIVALMLTVLIGFVALAIDIGYLMVTKNELQNVADGAALAAGRQLGANYQDMLPADRPSYVYDPTRDPDSKIIEVAQEVGNANKAAAKWININDADIVIGRWSAGLFSATPNKPNAVQVTARRDSHANSPIATFFAGVFGIDFLEISAAAVAALTGQGTTVPGELEMPVGISRKWFDDRSGEGCGDHIKFSPTIDPDACAGWTTFTGPANTPTLKAILDGDSASGPTIAGDTDFEYTGGDVAAAFSNLLLLYKRKGYDVYETDANGMPCPSSEPCWILDSEGNPVTLADDPAAVYYDAAMNPGVAPVELWGLDNFGNPIRLYYPAPIEQFPDDEYPDPPYRPRNKHAWETTVVVYENTDGTADCDNPHGSMTIVGYARIRLTDVMDAPDRLVVGELVCDYVDNEDSRGGGGEAFGGLMGPIPNLVQ